MLSLALHIASKDFLLLWRSFAFMKAILLGFLIIFSSSLAYEGQGSVSGQVAASLFWLASTFCLILISSTVYAFEEHNDTRTALCLLPGPVQAVWLGKGLVIFFFLCLSQVFFVVAILIFLSKTVNMLDLNVLAIFLTINVGMAALSALLGAMPSASSARESLLSLLLFPLLSPLLMAGIRVGSLFFDASLNEYTSSWPSLILAFDGLYIAAALLLYPFLFKD